ncbi:hypothetical protein KVG96_13940 [Pseudomonas sp. COR58]|uniref:HEAT repeat domain-containing protein n=1 Tax=Pseudomonas ekonensis TaxID=2842353 RepID=A0ABS6PF01_9PSED|nr:hypothetical protein [Pseudomonas ekonensis]MBV4459058.1 hypothetical protein [Pseudomonas ekonensis]
MISLLKHNNSAPAELANALKDINLTKEIQKLSTHLYSHIKTSAKQQQRATILDTVNPYTHTLTLHCTDDANISVRTLSNTCSTALYSVPGHSILFPVHSRPFTVQLYGIEGDRLSLARRVTVTDRDPLLVDGRHALYECVPPEGPTPVLVGSINLPVRSADISVFDRSSLRKVAWFPHDDSAARYLVSLELLEAAQDPGAVRVAEELIHHYHPAVAWKAFQIIDQHAQDAAPRYVPLLKKLNNPHLDHLLERRSEAA